MKIALYGQRINQSHINDVKHLLTELKSIGAEVVVHNKLMEELKKHQLQQVIEMSNFQSEKDLSSSFDFFFSLGGDGTFLDCILYVRELGIPIFGINTGRLGFLSNTPTTAIAETLNDLKNGHFQSEKRSMLKIESKRELFGENNFALNEISIMKRDSSSMITIHVAIDGMHLNSYWADGLIISTPTGSTAYSLSCGGPILMPGSGNFVITPIAPHNLNVRPIVIDDQSVIEIQVESRGKKNLVALDSRSKELLDEDILTIRKTPFPIFLVQPKSQSFLNSLRNKLSWGLDKRNTND